MIIEVDVSGMSLLICTIFIVFLLGLTIGKYCFGITNSVKGDDK